MNQRKKEDDEVYKASLNFFPMINNNKKDTSRFLEIGCSNGYRLDWYSEHGLETYGIEPSEQAVAEGISLGRKVVQGSADHLPFEDKYFDIVVLGFCLYLCDREYLFRIGYEVDRVSKDKSFIVILDFYNKNEKENVYHHKEGVRSYKMDYTKIFTWNPFYTMFSHEVRNFHLIGSPFTDEENDFVSLSILRKNIK